MYLISRMLCLTFQHLPDPRNNQVVSISTGEDVSMGDKGIHFAETSRYCLNRPNFGQDLNFRGDDIRHGFSTVSLNKILCLF
jgi:hypothetical protein